MTTVHRAVLLAAGRGKRMMPLTADRPKPLIPVAGQPILERILLGLRDAGIDEALIVVGYLGHMIEDYFGDGSRLGMRLSYLEQAEPNGTGGALMLVEDWCGDQPFLLHWGDILVTPSNYPAILAAYGSTDPAPVCVQGLNWMDDPAAGAAVYREGNRITAIVEKPAPGASTTNWNNAGVLVLGPAIWPYVRQLQPSPRGEYEFTDVLHAMIRHREPMIGYEIHGLWSDVGTPHVVEALNNDPRLTPTANCR